MCDWFAEKLRNLLNSAFVYEGISVDSYPLALYFATLLADDATKRYVQAAKEGLLRVYDPAAEDGKPMEPGSIEATCISDQAREYQEILRKMKDFLQLQTAKERFWEISEDWLETLGEYIAALEDVHTELIGYGNQYRKRG